MSIYRTIYMSTVNELPCCSLTPGYYAVNNEDIKGSNKSWNVTRIYLPLPLEGCFFDLCPKNIHDRISAVMWVYKGII